MKILLAVDGSEYTRKMLDYVCSHRALFDPSHEYTLFYAQSPLPPHARQHVASSIIQDYYREEVAKVLDPAMARLTSDGLKASPVWRIGPSGETIATQAEEGKYDMVIMGTHGHGSLARLVMGSVTTQVLAHCGVPVLLIR